MYANTCERCAGQQNLRDLYLAGDVPVTLCVKCQRAVDAFIRSLPECEKWEEACRVLMADEARAETSDPLDGTYWECWVRSHRALGKAEKPLRAKVLRWIDTDWGRHLERYEPAP